MKWTLHPLFTTIRGIVMLFILGESESRSNLLKVHVTGWIGTERNTTFPTIPVALVKESVAPIQSKILETCWHSR